MKKFLSISVLFLLMSVTLPAQETKNVVFMPQWTPQSQFAGFYIALEKGYYAEEGLNVEIRHRTASTSRSTIEILENGEVDIAGLQLLQGIIGRADGHPIINVMQLTQVSGLWCVSRGPIENPIGLNGKKVGRWRAGYSDFCDFLEIYNNIHINWIPFINGISLYVYGAVDAILCYSYSEYVALSLAIGHIPENNVIRFSDFGYDCPEDGIFVTEEYYKNNKETVDKFVRASKKGWDYVRTHQEEAVNLTMNTYVKEAHVQTNRTLQQRMLAEYLHLQENPASGEVDYAPVKKDTFDKIVDALHNINHIFQKVEYNEMIR